MATYEDIELIEKPTLVRRMDTPRVLWGDEGSGFVNDLVYGASPELVMMEICLPPGGFYRASDNWKANYDSAGFFSDYSPAQQFTFGEGLCGDFDVDGKTNLADINALIAYVYIDGDPPLVESVVNVNCDDKVNLADITALVDHVYITKAALCCSAP